MALRSGRSFSSSTAKSTAGSPLGVPPCDSIAACAGVNKTALTTRRAAGTLNESYGKSIPAIVCRCCISSTGERNAEPAGCVTVSRLPRRIARLDVRDVSRNRAQHKVSGVAPALADLDLPAQRTFEPHRRRAGASIDASGNESSAERLNADALARRADERLIVGREEPAGHAGEARDRRAAETRERCPARARGAGARRNAAPRDER